jgi:phospholipid/cholesterol/gamma-HCH transport system substrate-binding protein
MATRVQKIKVGVFLFACMAFLITVLVIISGMQRYPTAYYYISFNESVTGLDEGGEVRYNGVPVGQVDNIEMGMGGTVLVTLKIRKDKLHGVREDMVATLALRGITGIVYIELSGASKGKVLPEGSKIPSRLSFISNITESFPAILNSLNQILNKMNLALGDKDTQFKENLDNLFLQIDQTTRVMNDFVNMASSQTLCLSSKLINFMDQIDANTEKLCSEANSLMKNMNRTVSNVDSTVLKAGRRIDHIDVKKTLNKLHLLMDQATTTTLALESFIETSNRNAIGVEFRILTTLKQLQKTLRAGESLMKGMERDPSMLLHGSRHDEKRPKKRK